MKAKLESTSKKQKVSKFKGRISDFLWFLYLLFVFIYTD